MDTLFQGILDILDGLIPSAVTADFSGLNEVLAYIITISLLWGIILRPLLRVLRIMK
jgi:hypothetical protein